MQEHDLNSSIMCPHGRQFRSCVFFFFKQRERIDNKRKIFKTCDKTKKSVKGVLTNTKSNCYEQIVFPPKPTITFRKRRFIAWKDGSVLPVA